jgi:hypothetical protein
MTIRIKMTATTFSRPFFVEGADEALPAGRYELEWEQEILDAMFSPDCLRTSVLMRLPPKPGSPGLALTVATNWESLERALERDASMALPRVDIQLETMLSDAIVGLIMNSDGESENDVRQAVSVARARRSVQFGRSGEPELAHWPYFFNRPHAQVEQANTRSDRGRPQTQAFGRCDRERRILVPA